MRASELRAVHRLTNADIVQLGNDPQFFRVVAVERSSNQPDARCKVTLRSFDGVTGVTLIRAGFERVLTVPRGPVAAPS